MLSSVLAACALIFEPFSMLALAIGVLFGTIIGAMPGLGTMVAIAICIPFTLKMGSGTAIALLMGVYVSSIYGGSISAVLLNTPGTPQSACTGMDGYPMARGGKAGEALGWVTMASILGGLFSCLVLIAAAPTLAALSLKYGGPLEICALICMGLACITSLSEGNQVKGILMGLAGMFLATVGIDPLSGVIRFNFGISQLNSGFDIMPLIVGFFPLAELYYRLYESRSEQMPKPIECDRIKLPSWSQWKGRWVHLWRSSAIGCAIGCLPGTGGTAATFIAYTSAKRLSKNSENFGKGEPDGLVAAESSNNAVAGGAMVPTLALGIPGEPAMALMLATLTLHGIIPGVRLMVDNPDVVYMTFGMLILGNLLLLPAAMICVRGMGYFIRLPVAVIMGLIVVCSMLGVYLPRGNMFDVWIALPIGIVAFFMRVNNFPIAPFIIGYVLSFQLEYQLSQVMSYMADDPFIPYLLDHPVALVLLGLAIALLVAPMFRKEKASCT